MVQRHVTSGGTRADSFIDTTPLFMNSGLIKLQLYHENGEWLTPEGVVLVTTRILTKLPKCPFLVKGLAQEWGNRRFGSGGGGGAGESRPPHARPRTVMGPGPKRRRS